MNRKAKAHYAANPFHILYKLLLNPLKKSWDGLVGIAMGYGLDSLVSNPNKDKNIFFLLCPDWLWVPPSLLSNGYWGLFPSLGKVARA
jgi:hypothetical protein